MRPYSALRSGLRIYWDEGFAGSSYELSDIAYGLARGPRFSGQMRGEDNYSIAQHSVLVAELLRSRGPVVQLVALFHDSEEFMLGDLGTPIKRCLPEYKKFAASFRDWIFQQEALPPLESYPQVKWADEVAMLIEGQSLMQPEDNWNRAFAFGKIEHIWPVKHAAECWLLSVHQARAAFRESITSKV